MAEVDTTVGVSISDSTSPSGTGTTGDEASAGSTADPTSGPGTDPTSDSQTSTSTDGGASEESATTGVPSEHVIFVSSGDLSGDLAPITGADELCTQLAMDAGLTGDTWLAILSDSTIDARDRIDVTGPIRNVAGELIAESEADLWDGFIAAPVRYTEAGEEFLASPLTGTNPDGTAANENCNDWTSAGGAMGVVGDAGFASEIWIDAGAGGCGQSYPVYCISQ